VIYDEHGAVVNRDVLKSGASSFLVRQGELSHSWPGNPEQPEVVGHTLARYVDMRPSGFRWPLQLPFDFQGPSSASRFVAAAPRATRVYVAK